MEDTKATHKEPTMTLEAIRDALAKAAAEGRVVKVATRAGDVLTGIPSGAGKPRWFKIEGETVHQYNITEVTEN